MFCVGAGRCRVGELVPGRVAVGTIVACACVVDGVDCVGPGVNRVPRANRVGLGVSVACLQTQ